MEVSHGVQKCYTGKELMGKSCRGDLDTGMGGGGVNSLLSPRAFGSGLQPTSSEIELGISSDIALGIVLGEIFVGPVDYRSEAAVSAG